jgi:hypothetical protein
MHCMLSMACSHVHKKCVPGKARDLATVLCIATLWRTVRVFDRSPRAKAGDPEAMLNVWSSDVFVSLLIVTGMICLQVS